MELSKKSLLKHCRELKMYSTPELNEKLYLQTKGISKLQNLDEYTGIKVLWLQTNCIEKIENLSHMTQLRHLYLHENVIKTIDGENELSNLVNLDTLNLEHNYISEIKNNDLANLKNLSTLNLAFNKLSTIHSLRGLLYCPSVSVLDLKNNQIEIDENLIDDILSKLPNLKVLYLISTNKNGRNKISEKMQNYRKTAIGKLRNLRHLDDRPIFDDERRCCDAWINGGIEAERLERQKIMNEKREKQENYVKEFNKMVQEAKAKRENNNDEDISSTDDDDDDIESESDSKSAKDCDDDNDNNHDDMKSESHDLLNVD